MAFTEALRKLMGWCPMKNSPGKRKKIDYFSELKLENGILELSSSPAGIQESRIFKVQINIFPERWAVIILVFTLITSLVLWTYSPESSFLIILSELILYLPLILLLFSHHPSAVTVMPEKIIIKRPLRKPVVIEKENIRQISIEKNENRSLRWPMRLVFLATFPVILFRAVERIVRDLHMEVVPASIKISLFLSQSLVVAYLLVFFYDFELRAPYQQILKVTTRSNLKIWLYTREPEELIAFLKNEKE